MPGPWRPYNGPAGRAGHAGIPPFNRTCWCGGPVTASKRSLNGYEYRLKCFANVYHDPEWRESPDAANDERAALVAKWRAVSEGDGYDSDAEQEAWDQMAEWKHDRDECLRFDCTNVTPGHSFCPAHRVEP